MVLISNVVPYDDYRLLIELSNGHGVIINFESKLDTLRFSMLENKDIFRRVYTDGFSLLWSRGKLRVSMSEIMEILQSKQTLFMVS